MKRHLKNRESNLGTFFTNCSVRGVSKAYKSRSLIIKLLWLIFITVMMILMLYSIIKILKEYMEYNTTMQNVLQFEDASDFPAITICPHQPFFQRSIKFFKNKGMSPKDFSLKLRKVAKAFLEKQAPDKAENILFYDNLRSYYQNLKYNESTYIGLTEKEIFVYCITKLKHEMLLGEVEKNCGYVISRYSSPDFFNCYTLNMRPEYLKNTEYIQLILRFPKPHNLSQYMEISFLQTLSRNAIGAQLLIHESGSSPTSTKEKIHIEPNRILQINYRNVYWKEYSTPNDVCLSKQENLNKIIDLENNYTFTFQGCLESYIAKKILEKCQCIMAFFPRSVIPSEKFPYCADFHNITEEGFERFVLSTGCIRKVLNKDQKLSSSDKKCFKVCEEQKFNLQISNIYWEPSLWQLEWLYKLQKSWNILIDSPDNLTLANKAKTVAMKFLSATGLAELSTGHDNSLFNNDEMYACVVLERLSNETYYKEEKLGLSMHGLISRIGASCTLYLGLTCAFFIEILEYLILNWMTRNTGKNEVGRDGKETIFEEKYLVDNKIETAESSLKNQDL